MHPIPLSKRLFFRQARNAILVALSLGVIISMIQILFDFRTEQKRINRTVIQVLNTAKASASQAAYSLNTELADRVVNGLFEYRPIYFAQINDDFGRQLATRKRPAVEHDLEWLSPLIDVDYGLYSVPLYIQDNAKSNIGEMRVRVDRFLVAQNFIQRAGFVILTGIVRNCILAVFFGFLFYFTLGRPVMTTVGALSGIDPAEPGKNRLVAPRGHGDDELGLLTDKLNDILQNFQETLDERSLHEAELQKNQHTIHQLNQRLEERVRQRTSELEAANKEMEAFTYSVSHDLRAPLRTIAGFSDILQDEYGKQMDEQAHHYLDRVRKGTHRMETLINDLLKLSRSTRGEMHPTSIDMSALVEEILEELQQTTPLRQVSLQVTPNIRCLADKRFIRLVLENLLSNAWKYTSKQENAEIIFGKIMEDKREIFFVQDNGAGFDMHYADKLFTPFQRLHSTREFDGTGVGLATVQHIIHRHGGDVWATAEIDKGATFYFTLPHRDLDGENGYSEYSI